MHHKSKNMSKKTIVVWTIVAVLALAVIYTFNNSFFSLKKSVSLSPNILYVTQPVNSISGKLEKIEKDNIIISRQIDSTASIPGKTISYKVLTTDKTIFIRLSAPNIKSITLKELTLGKTVDVVSKVDLRILKDNQFEALSISEIPEKNYILY